MNSPSRLHSRWYRSIKFRLLAFGVTMSVVPLLLLGLYSMKTARSDLEDSIHEHHAMVAVRVANDTADIVGTLRTSLETMATAEPHRLLSEPPDVRERLLYAIMKRSPYIEELAVVNREGQELTRVSRRYAIGPNDLRRVSPSPGLKEIFQGRPYVGAARLEPDNQVVFTLAVPLEGVAGIWVQGGLIAQVSLRGVMERIASLPVGGGGYIFLVDGQGSLIGHEDFGQVLKGQDVRGSRSVMELLNGGGSESIPEPIRYTSYTGQEVLGVYTRVRGTDWGVVIEQPVLTAYGPLWDLIIKLAGAMTLAMAVATGLSVFFALFFTRSLEALAEGVRRVAGGDLQHRIPSQGEDELGQVVDAFNDMTAELRRRREMEVVMFQAEKMTAVGMLAAGVAHEINNPMNTLSFYATDLLERLSSEGANRLEESGEIQHYLQIMQEQIVRCTSITCSLLNFARPQSEHVDYVQVEKLITDTLPLIRYRLRKQGVELVVEIPPDFPGVEASSSQLQQVILNLLTNALDAMPQGGTLHISGAVDDTKTPATVRLIFSDTGHGIPEDKIQHIFQPFYTTKPVGQGTGLGLSICYGIVARLRGRIFAENGEGCGTRIIVELLSPRRSCNGPFSYSHR